LRPVRFAALENGAWVLAPQPFVAIDDQVPAQQDLLDASSDLAAFEQAVGDPAVVLGGADRPGLARIEEGEVGIGIDGDDALAREEAEQPGP